MWLSNTVNWLSSSCGPAIQTLSLDMDSRRQSPCCLSVPPMPAKSPKANPASTATLTLRRTEKWKEPRDRESLDERLSETEPERSVFT